VAIESRERFFRAQRVEGLGGFAPFLFVQGAGSKEALERVGPAIGVARRLGRP
jgi:hypothetical protein